VNVQSDRYSRKIDYMRISVTDRCNFRCVYCMPTQGIPPLRHKDILRYEEIIRIVRVAVGSGLRRIRITGGEPLIRRDIVYLIESLKRIEGIRDLSLTTNGAFLAGLAESLSSAGLQRINVSLDSLQSERFAEITRGGELSSVLKGIDAAMKAGLSPLKINCVPIRGLNEDEIESFALMTLKQPFQVRFIEFMPLGKGTAWTSRQFIPTEEIRSIVEKIGPLKPVTVGRSGPADYFAFEGAAGIIGFISPLSNHFCGECNRLRLTSDGKLRPCLFSESEIDLKPALRGGIDDGEIARLLSLAVQLKPEGHKLGFGKERLESFIRRNSLKPMSRIGG
jgi:GTP 3',8-cyclase